MDLLTKVRSQIEKLGPRRSTGNLLHKFQICWDTINFEVQVESNLSRNVDRTEIPQALQQMLDILVKEQSMVDRGLHTTNGCAEMFLNNDMLGQLVKLSQADVPLGFRGEVIQTISSLISLLEGKSLFHKSVNGAAVALMRSALASRDHKYEDAMLELESNISTKIHELPALLHLFFTKRPVTSNVSTEAVGGLVGARDDQDSGLDEGSYDFPLFDHLLRYVHIEGRRGDVARTSCLFLLQLQQDELQDCIARSDFAITVIAGIGGLFSQLPPQLPDLNPGGRQGYALVTFTRDVESLCGLLRFVQDVLAKCPSPDTCEAILREFRVTFLEHVVQPQLMTASDFDGTTVAVLYYICKMLDVVWEERFSSIFVRFLLQGDDVSDDQDATAIDDVELHVRDVLVSKLNSLSEEVVTQTLRFFHSLLTKHRVQVLALLLETMSEPKFAELSSNFTVDAHQHLAVVRRYFALMNTAHAAVDHGTTLEAYLEDAETALLSSRMTSRASSPTKDKTKGESITIENAELLEQLDRLGRDATLQKFIGKLSTFFSHSMEINLALTGVLSKVAASPHPLLNLYLFSSDILLGPQHPSLYVIITRLLAEVSTKRAQLGEDVFDNRLEMTRAALYEGDWVEGVGELDLEGEFVKNVVVLEEFVKELVAVLVTRGEVSAEEVAFV
ncbi:uncharacterized protein SPPG_00036 [Spizellomyces punctatus DAOM BR117]|uniref:FHF complex subunit HOOK-interacting protein C-terminal domain-containing protein n=1 Tax=Spizellomyces punctatus (strain DAOM BR117) TaxID=645134 RepID=A0A0L0HT58_SPIPD|nr:uncharacterized protein SPPG_00036 [Spizellomyces punctatus DAOM BR117]KND04303.1 hypothetical protein SPPG_00036 [Spizellomyces punctatus DAOM BR117]|eukprot:XP_016612342.1 hypothetical protein SPPG_00036 [Spizellomyces punctatus DAOM BR117]